MKMDSGPRNLIKTNKHTHTRTHARTHARTHTQQSKAKQSKAKQNNNKPTPMQCITVYRDWKMNIGLLGNDPLETYKLYITPVR